MIEMQLTEAARAVDGRLFGKDLRFRGCSTDSRSVSQGQLFAALRGPVHDGHRFAADALSKGATAAMVERQLDSVACVVVPDSRTALGKLARHWRQRFSTRVVGITGSNGKTTVKEMLATILRAQGEVLSTQGNFNNDIGLPLTLFCLDRVHEFAVLEMGANHPGEITTLSEIARPQVAVVTQIAPAHLEGFGDVGGVARAKGEIIDGLPSDGTAVLNADDDYYGTLRERAGARRVIRFGLSLPADVRAGAVELDKGINFVLSTPAGSAPVRMALAGRHNLLNALAAAAAAHAVGVEPASIAAGLAEVRPISGRLEPKAAVQGALLLDDTYNANPTSLRAGLLALTQYPGTHWLILADMGELGQDAAELHRRAGRQARESGIEKLFGLGELTRFAVEEFGSGGRFFDGPDDLREAVAEELDAGTVVLVKGSRFMRLERVVRGLEA